MLSPYGSRIWVGANAGSDAKSRQGIVNVIDPKCPTATKSIPIIIRPAGAVRKGLCWLHYRNVVAQLKNMGINPVTIEIDGQNTRYVYDGNQYVVLMREEKPKPLPRDPGTSMMPA